jgi:hypothetical protein
MEAPINSLRNALLGRRCERWKRRIKKPNSEEARRDHEDSKFGALINIKAPMAPERGRSG